MEQIAAQVPDYAGLTYKKLAEVTGQWPIIGRSDLYYGGTQYQNTQGLGVQLAPAAQRGAQQTLAWVRPPEQAFPAGALVAVPITRLYDRGKILWPSRLLHARIGEPRVLISPATAASLGATQGGMVQVSLNGVDYQVKAAVDEAVPEGVVLVPRSFGLPLWAPAPVEVKALEQMVV
jgi:NADH-quinone oxidoreductase subunit G